MFMAGQGVKAQGIAYSEAASPTLKSTLSGGNTVPTVVCMQGNMMDRATAQNGSGISQDVAPTVNTADRHAVCYAPNGNHCGAYDETDTAATLETKYHYGSGGDAALVCDARGNGDGSTVPNLTGDHENRVTDYTALYCRRGFGDYAEDEKTRTLCAAHDWNQSDCVVKHDHRYIVRRLTPLECCRLQGFPDYWTEDVPGSDSAKYKMWGNGMSLTCLLYTLQGIGEEKA